MTSKLTREQLHERARENVKALKMASRQHAFESAREEILADLQLAKLALAAMDSDPVAWLLTDPEFGHSVATRSGYTLNWYRSKGWDITPLYRHAQPAPVVPDFKKLARELVDNLVDCGGLDEGVKEKYLEWAEKTCRAAMLQAGTLANEDTKQAGNSPVIPDGYVMVPKVPTAEMQSAGASAIRIETTALNKLWTGNAVFRAMLAAAEQEVPDGK